MFFFEKKFKRKNFKQTKPKNEGIFFPDKNLHQNDVCRVSCVCANAKLIE